MSFLPIRSLVIEEHPFKRLVATRAFQDLGLGDVISATNSATAMEILKSTGLADVVLCSLKAQCMQSLAAIEELCASGLVSSIIICSNHSADLHSAIDRMLTLHRVKVLGYVDAPVHPSTIKPMLEQFGRNTEMPRPDTSRPAIITLFNETELKEAISANEFRAFFQPKFNLVTNVVDSLEVLVRWNHPRHGMLCPSDFLPLLSSFSLMDDLLFTLMEQGLSFLEKISHTERLLHLAFNVQAEQFSNPDLVTKIAGLLDKYQIPASRLTFEITESGLLEFSPRVLKSLIQLRMMGSGLSIDDFGTGFSSLERLCHLPFTEIKLDASFIRDLDNSINKRAVIISTLALGKSLNMSVIVEGVETESQRASLIKLGCTHAQGYLCARPMSSKQSELWLNSKRARFNNA
ncbi:EAL domain-containing response regulator [Pseudomonas sp. URMO17WK12:I11]|uniref:EAL domain-containing response regulator n=1 Tax=Pseudomonas sp. URMO17WK12:I11 TaxID=1283291 RepID=UPI00071EAE57|nr:EAL domain-containing response regulator [Pseudomonas sp. URMO17WK12:I11]CRL51636.1 Phytochrome-like protein cph2 [Pseudomonas sp. URMO17WK12:I11]